MLPANIDVFISYSHDSPEHIALVLALADRLRRDGINAMIDQYLPAPPEGWHLWMEKQIRDARFVLLVCTQTYLRRVMREEAQEGQGRGVMWESAIIYQYIYNAGAINERFIPVVFGQEDRQYIPVPLQPTSYYDVSTDEGYLKLYRHLTDQPETPAPALGRRRALPPRERSTTQSSSRLRDKLTPHFVDPYALQANFTGRVAEREELTAWLADDARPVCALVAMGGMGKSALAWYWMQKDVLARAQAADADALEGVMWWSFYEGESSFAKFIDEALKYVTDRPIDAKMFPTTYDRAQELRKQLQNKRVLFILDGFERQLRAYATLDAAYQRDDAVNLSREACACVEPDAARLLQHIAAGTTRAKVLLTTRLMAHDLEDRAGDPLAGVLKRELKELPRDDAVAFMRAQGVRQGTAAEIAAVCDDYGNHPLSMRLLSGFIARDARMPGDIAAAPRHDVHDDLVQRQHHVLEQSYNALHERERALLSRIAAFRSAVTYDALAIFNEFDDEATFDAALEDLQTRGLILRDTARKRYDLHPIVRHYAYDRLIDKAGVHARLRDYFADIPPPDKVRSIEDLAPVIELYHHTVRAGHFNEAVRLYYDRIWRELFYRFGAYQTQIELLHTLFPNGEDRLPRPDDESALAWSLHELANAYSLSGQPRRAVRLFTQHNSAREEEGDDQNLAIGLENLGFQQINLGELAAAEQSLRRGVKLCFEMNDEAWEAVGHQELGRLLMYLGAFDEAEPELNTAQDMFDKYGVAQTNYVSGVRAYRALRALMMGDARAALEWAKHAWALADEVARMRYPHERDFIQAEWLLGSALLMERRDLNAAAAYLSEALKRCRRINLVELEPDILLARGRWHFAQGNTEEAQKYAEEALAIADRCEFRLKQAEIHNFLARLALDAGKLEAAREHTETARERALCDGPPHCYKPALDEADAMLEELG